MLQGFILLKSNHFSSVECILNSIYYYQVASIFSKQMQLASKITSALYLKPAFNPVFQIRVQIDTLNLLLVTFVQLSRHSEPRKNWFWTLTHFYPEKNEVIDSCGVWASFLAAKYSILRWKSAYHQLNKSSLSQYELESRWTKA